MPVPSTIKKRFLAVLSNTEKNISEFVKNPNSDMTRHRCCPFLDTFLLTCSFTAKRSSTELFDYFSLKNRYVPSKSAFTQQRKKFNDRLFPHVFDTFNKEIPFKKKYNGLHLVAIDGSDLNLPTDKNDSIYAVKQTKSDNFYYQMHLNAMYDICENRYCGLVTQPRPEMNEHAAFRELIDHYECSEPTVFIADRGYESLANIAHVINKGMYFLIRAKKPNTGGSLITHIIQPNTEVDTNISFGVTRNRAMHAANPTFYKILSAKRNETIIPFNDRKSVCFFNLRAICIKLETGEYEYLITNLPKDDFSTTEIKSMYGMRWGIETSFRSLKYAISLSYLHSVNRELIIQEVYAKLILYNFASLIHRYANDSFTLRKDNTCKYKVAFENTIPIARFFLTKAMSNLKIKILLLRHLTRIRAPLHKPRNVRSQRAMPLSNRT